MSEVFDLIVLGSGGAGLVAALTAHELGAKVLLVSKAPLGKNSCTTYAGGGFTYAGPGGDPGEHQAKTLEIGRGINDPSLLEVFAYQGPDAVARLRSWGVHLDERPNGGSVGRGSLLPGVGGLGMTLPLVEEIRKRGIPTLEQWTAVELLCDDNRFTGVLAVNLTTGRVEALAAKAVLVATGGGGRVYSRTNNPVGTTGDGYHLLARLGLSFRDMEFVQFYPIGIAEPDLPLWFIDLGIIDRAPLTDSTGCEFLKEMLRTWGLNSGREGNLFARDRSSIAILQKWREGEKILLHLNHLSDEAWQQPYNRNLLRLNRPNTFDFTRRPIRVRPLQHYMSGGVVIDLQGSTGIPGLFACGEVTGGVDGANRIGGNALTNITLFGQRAATAAAAYVRTVTAPPVPNASSFTSFEGWRRNLSGPTPRALLERLQTTMDTEVSPLRDEAGLKRANDALLEIGSQLSKIALDNTRAILGEAIELQSLHTTATLIVRAALKREESRGVHFRLDHPEEKPQWQKPIVQKL